MFAPKPKFNPRNVDPYRPPGARSEPGEITPDYNPSPHDFRATPGAEDKKDTISIAKHKPEHIKIEKPTANTVHAPLVRKSTIRIIK